MGRRYFFVIIITDLLYSPFDEGAKNTVFNILKNFNSDVYHKLISVNGDLNIGFEVEVCKINKTFFNIQFLSNLRSCNYSKILYIPESSATLFSLVRSKLLHRFTNKSVVLIALQPRKYDGLMKIFARFLAPEKILTPSKSYAAYLKCLGLKSTVVPLGVDDNVYKPLDEESINKQRLKFNIDDNKIVLLHVGHICLSRNLQWMLSIKKNHPDIEVVVVGSSYTAQDSELYDELELCGIRIIDQYIKNMAGIYNMANYYLFPVLDDQGSIATPLSVLEAMACNIPIITTKFGSLVDMFNEDDDFHFVDTSDDVLQHLKNANNSRKHCTNRKKIENYTWKNFAKRIEEIVGE